MRKVGLFGFDDNTADKFYINELEDTRVFYLDDQGNNVPDDDTLTYWAQVINSPWSQAHEKYVIKLNCKDAYTEMDENEPAWICTYTIIGFEAICGEIIGYGSTEEEALKDCRDLFKYLQENYNKENVSF